MKQNTQLGNQNKNGHPHAHLDKPPTHTHTQRQVCVCVCRDKYVGACVEIHPFARMQAHAHTRIYVCRRQMYIYTDTQAQEYIYTRVGVHKHKNQTSAKLTKNRYETQKMLQYDCMRTKHIPFPLFPAPAQQPSSSIMSHQHHLCSRTKINVRSLDQGS